MNYAHPLRAIGQALEMLELDNFYVEPDGKCFRVCWQVPIANFTDNAVEESVVRHVWGLRPGQSFAEIGRDNLKRRAVTRRELRYSPEDVDRLDLAGKAHRHRDPIGDRDTRLSQLLRALGEYLNQKNARLLRILRSGESVTVEFKTAAGETGEERFTFSELTEITVSMYSRRTRHTLH